MGIPCDKRGWAGIIAQFAGGGVGGFGAVVSAKRGKCWALRPGVSRPGNGALIFFLQKPRFYPAWRPTLLSNPALISLDGKPSVCLAWRQTQRLSRLAAGSAFVSLGDEFSVYLA